MFAYARICGPVSVRYRSSETNYQHGYRHKCISLIMVVIAKTIQTQMYIIMVVC